MTGNGADPDAAFRSAMDALGDTDELVDYLNGLAPDEPLPGPGEGQPQDGASIQAPSPWNQGPSGSSSASDLGAFHSPHWANQPPLVLA